MKSTWDSEEMSHRAMRQFMCTSAEALLPMATRVGTTPSLPMPRMFPWWDARLRNTVAMRSVEMMVCISQSAQSLWVAPSDVVRADLVP